MSTRPFVQVRVPRRAVRWWLALWLLLATTVATTIASAQPRAWLDRDRIAAGETVTLNIETDSDDPAPPDYTALQRDFIVSGHSSRRSFEISNGRTTTSTRYAVALRPRGAGVLTVAPVRVGGERTAAITLVVAAAAAATPARAGASVFIEAEADDTAPYVQQAVGWVVRLYSAAPLVSGQIDQPAPDGATLQRVGDDAQYTRDINGRQYRVVERRFLLVPERSGTLTVPGASFEGRGTGGFFDDLFGDRGGALSAQAQPRFLQVRPPPVNAPQPWLPLHALQLRYQTAPAQLRVGAAASLVVEVTADGATAAQMPELALPAVDGVQVFAEPVKSDESFANGRPRVRQVRRYALVPTRAGELQVPGLQLRWWDVAQHATRVARLPPLTLSVGGAAASATGGAGATSTGAATAVIAPQQRADNVAGNPWALAALAFAGLWLATLIWAMQRRNGARESAPAPRDTASSDAAVVGLAQLRHVLDRGDLGDVADTLRAMATPPATSMDALRRQLGDSHQREAVDALERARWAGGDGVAARQMLRAAFAKGPRWHANPVPPPPLLPPLYPDR